MKKVSALVLSIGVLCLLLSAIAWGQGRTGPQEGGRSTEEVAVRGTAEVGPAILAATLSFLALFLPFLLVPGMVSLLFHELILVISGIVVVSLLLAISLTPMLTAVLTGKPGRSHGEGSRFERFFAWVTEWYGVLLSHTLRHRKTAMAGFVILLLGAVLLVPFLGSEFLPQIDDGRVVVKVKLPTGTAVGETNKLLSQVEAKLVGDPLIESYVTMAGARVWGLATYEIAEEGEVDIQLVPRHARKVSTKEYIERLKTTLAKTSVPGGKPMVMQMRIKGILKVGDADIEVKIRGDELDKLFNLARQAAESMNKLQHFTNVYVSMDLSKPEYQVVVDRTRAAELGLSVVDVANTVRSLVSGAVATRYREGDYFYNIRVMIPEKHFASRQDIENLVLNSSHTE